jgi:hypothetical protein
VSVEQSESLKRRGTVCVCVHVRGGVSPLPQPGSRAIGFEERERHEPSVFMEDHVRWNGENGVSVGRASKGEEDREGPHRCQNYQYQNQSKACGRVELATNPKLGNIAVLLRNTARNVLAYPST